MKVPLTIILCIWVAHLGTSSPAAEGESYVPGEIMLRVAPTYLGDDQALDDLDANLAQVALTPEKLLSRRLGIWLLKFESATLSDHEVVEIVRAAPQVQAAQFNHHVQLREIHPNDPDFDLQWALHHTGPPGIADADIDAPEAWDYGRGQVTALGDTIVLAIVDDGFNLDHPDLNYWRNWHEVPDNDLDDDGNGYIDDVQGWNAYLSRGSLPGSSHGSHVTGIAAARGSNSEGICGVGWGTEVLPIAGASGTESVVVEAYGYALEMRALYNETGGAKGAFVVATNASFGVDEGQPEDYPLWCGIYDALGEAGVLSTGATANQDWNIDEMGDMPTACGSDYLITVTNTSAYDGLYGGSGYGATTIDLGAPGASIYSTCLGTGYCYKTGTSMATPHVTGAIAVLLSNAAESLLEQYRSSPGAVALDLKGYILDGVDQLGALSGITVSGGRLNLAGALSLLPRSMSSTDESFGDRASGGVRIVGASPNPSFGVTNLLLHSSGGRGGGGQDQVTIYDHAGRRVRTLPVQASTAGELAVTWDGRDHRGLEVLSGVYYCNLDAGASPGLAQRVIVVR